jgi:hypothetical protein
VRGKIAGAHALDGDIGFLVLQDGRDSQPLEDEGRRHRGGSALGVDADLLARQVLQRIDLRAGDDADLLREHHRDIAHLALDGGDLRIILEVLERIGLQEGQIDAAQVEHVPQVLHLAAGDDREHAHLLEALAFVEQRRKVERGRHQRPAEDALGHEGDRARVGFVLGLTKEQRVGRYGLVLVCRTLGSGRLGEHGSRMEDNAQGQDQDTDAEHVPSSPSPPRGPACNVSMNELFRKAVPAKLSTTLNRCTSAHLFIRGAPPHVV